jgi:regulator of protease activity HflC (stomatin/prohibitin superfamily)
VNTKFKKIAAMVAIVPLMFVTACGVSTPPDETKLQIGAGPFEDPKIKGCVAPGEKRTSPTNDEYIAYPVSGRDYDAGTTEGGDSGPITVISSDNTEMAIPVRITWDFASDCKSLEAFYKLYNRYGAELNDEGQMTDGFRQVLAKVLGNSLDTTLDEIAKDYKWRDLYNNAAAQNALQSALDENLQAVVDEVAKGEFFTNINVATIKKPVPTNQELKDAIAAEQSAVATAQSAEAKARATKAQAEAETATAKAEAAKQQAIIEGYGGFDNYAEAEAIKNGLNPYQPTYIVNGTKP